MPSCLSWQVSHACGPSSRGNRQVANVSTPRGSSSVGQQRGNGSACRTWSVEGRLRSRTRHTEIVPPLRTTSIAASKALPYRPPRHRRCLARRWEWHRRDPCRADADPGTSLRPRWRGSGVRGRGRRPPPAPLPGAGRSWPPGHPSVRVPGRSQSRRAESPHTPGPAGRSAVRRTSGRPVVRRPVRNLDRQNVTERTPQQLRLTGVAASPPSHPFGGFLVARLRGGPSDGTGTAAFRK